MGTARRIPPATWLALFHSYTSFAFAILTAEEDTSLRSNAAAVARVIGPFSGFGSFAIRNGVFAVSDCVLESDNTATFEVEGSSSVAGSHDWSIYLVRNVGRTVNMRSIHERFLSAWRSLTEENRNKILREAPRKLEQRGRDRRLRVRYQKAPGEEGEVSGIKEIFQQAILAAGMVAVAEKGLETIAKSLFKLKKPKSKTSKPAIPVVPDLQPPAEENAPQPSPSQPVPEIKGGESNVPPPTPQPEIPLP